VKSRLPKHVHRKKAKGRTYYYFDLGKDAAGRRILKRLPDVRHKDYPSALAAAKAMRTRGDKATGANTFDWLVRLYEKSPEFKAKAENTKKLYSRHLAYANAELRNRLGHSGPLNVLSAQHIVIVRDKYADEPGKANAILKSLGAMFAWAMKPGRNYLKSNPATGIELFEMGVHEPWPGWLVDAALGDPAIRLPVALLYFTGQRIGDVVKLGRGNIANGVLSVTQQKTDTSLRIQVHKRLAEIIEQDAPKDAMVFLLGDKGRPVTESGLRQRIQKWAKDKHKLHIVPHGLRRNAVNALLEAGCSTAEVSAITGQDLKTIEHYAKERDREHLGRSAILKFEARNK
jgi:integrase